MKLEITFKNLDHTVSLDQKIKEKTKKLNKFFKGDADVHWTCSTSSKGHIAEIKVNGSNYTLFATGKSDSLYKSLDMAMAKIEKQARKAKAKRRDKIHSNQAANVIPFRIESTDPVIPWYEEELRNAA